MKKLGGLILPGSLHILFAGVHPGRERQMWSKAFFPKETTQWCLFKVPTKINGEVLIGLCKTR